MTVVPGPTDVPGPGAPGSPPPASGGINADLWAELGNVADWQYQPPPTTLKSADHGDPTGGEAGNTDSFIDGVFQFIGDILGVLVYPIKQIIAWVWDGVKAAAQWAWDFAADIWNSVVDIFRAIFDTITAQIGLVFGFISDLVGEAWKLGTEALDWIANKGEWLLSQIGDVASLVLGIVEGAIGWIWDHLISPVTDLVLSLLGDALDAALGALGWVWDRVTEIATAVVNAVLDAASWIWDKVSAIASALVNAAIDALGIAWDILQAAWGWIVWFAEHTFGWFEDLFALSVHGVGDVWVNGIVNALNRSGDDIEAYIADWLG